MQQWGLSASYDKIHLCFLLPLLRVVIWEVSIRRRKIFHRQFFSIYLQPSTCQKWQASWRGAWVWVCSSPNQDFLLQIYAQKWQFRRHRKAEQKCAAPLSEHGVPNMQGLWVRDVPKVQRPWWHVGYQECCACETIWRVYQKITFLCINTFEN